jgi:hypothetical protein
LGFTNTSAAVPLVVPGRTVLTITRGNGTVTLSWPGGGVLQHTGTLGPQPVWTDVTNAPSSPFTTPITGSQQYFRVRH